MHSHVLVGLSVNHQLRWNFTVGILECGQLLFPIAIFEFEKEGPKNIRVVERSVGIGWSVRWCHFWSRSGRGVGAVTPGWAPAPAPPHGTRLALEILAGGFALCRVEAFV